MLTAAKKKACEIINPLFHFSGSNIQIGLACEQILTNSCNFLQLGIFRLTATAENLPAEP
jgi:hypothetical protein